jgi:molybdopterin synthase catalytic subunit
MILITNNPILLQNILAETNDSAAGAVSLFIGTVRNHNEKGAVRQIKYESYKEMAEEIMLEIERETRAKWRVNKITMVHRIGLLNVGEASVVVAVSAGHRKEAFEACRYGIDNIKSRVPIWKKEIMKTDEQWVDGVLAASGI